jgi:hypothetical protein
MTQPITTLGPRRALRTLVPIIAVSVSLAACGSSSSSSSSGSASNGSSSSGTNMSAATAIVNKALAVPSAIDQTTPLKSAPAAGSVVYLNNGTPAGVVIGTGIQNAATAAGWTYSSITFDGSNPSTLQSAALNALAKHPTVVSEAGTPQDSFGTSVLAKYKAAGVALIPSATPGTATGPVPVSDENIPGGTGEYTAMAKILAAWFVKDSGGKGTALIPNVAYPVLEPFVSSFQKEVAALCPSCKVDLTPVSLSDLSAGSVVNNVVQAVRRQGANYVIWEDAEFGVGAENALKSAGLSSVKTAGVGPLPSNIKLMQAGADVLESVIDPCLVNNGFQYVGWATMDLGFRYQQKMDLGTSDATQPVQLLTTSNAKAASSVVNRPIPATGLAQFEKLWKIK